MTASSHVVEVIARLRATPPTQFTVEQIRSLTVHLQNQGRYKVEARNPDNDSRFEDAPPFTFSGITSAGVYDRFEDALSISNALNMVWRLVAHKSAAEIVEFVIGPELPE